MHAEARAQLLWARARHAVGGALAGHTDGRLPDRLPSLSVLHDSSRRRSAQATAHLTMEHDGRKPSAALVGETLDWPVSRVQRAIQGFSRSTVLALVPSRSEDTSTGSYGGVAADSIKSSAHGIGDAEMSILKEQFRNSVRKVQEGREPEHAKMLALRYGLYDGVEWSTKQIAERFQVTSQVVYKIIRQEVKYLQARHQDFTSFVQADARELAIVRRTRGVPVRTPTRV